MLNLRRIALTPAAGLVALLTGPPAGAAATAAAPTVQLTERDGLGDVYSWRSIAPPFRPEIDLLAAGVAQERDELRLRIVTAAPARDARLDFGASEREECADAQLLVAIVVEADGAVTVRATDRPSRLPRRIPTAAITRAGNELELRLPLLATPALASWTVSSRAPSSAPMTLDGWFGEGDTIPDWELTGASFTPDTGTPEYPPLCGPADPPLLPR